MIHSLKLTCYGATPQEIEDMAYHEAMKFWGVGRDQIELVCSEAVPEYEVHFDNAAPSVAQWCSEVRAMLK